MERMTVRAEREVRVIGKMKSKKVNTQNYTYQYV
jgi:hypothetical protein